MNQVNIGDKLPEFQSIATGEQHIKLSDLAGKKVVLYFYPKDSTPGCTLEGQAFRDNIGHFTANNVVIFGVSRDKLSAHEKFKKKQQFPFELLSDEDGVLCQLFGVLKEKSMFGKKYIGIERSTFLIDERGVLRHEWRKVKVKGHVDDVLGAVKSI